MALVFKIKDYTMNTNIIIALFSIVLFLMAYLLSNEASKQSNIKHKFIVEVLANISFYVAIFAFMLSALYSY